MSADENKAIVRRFIDEVLMRGEVEVIDEIAAPTMRGHLPVSGWKDADREGWKEFNRVFMTGLSDRRVEIEGLIADEEQVAARGTLHLLHAGDFQGVPATGKTVAVDAWFWFRFANGKVVEHWGQGDLMGLLQQLGAMPAPAGPLG
jgi:predicted ester cyclase